MVFTWFDHPLIEAWLERQLANPSETVPVCQVVCR